MSVATVSVPGLRLLAAPDSAPPYDDELALPVATPVAPLRLAPLRLVPDAPVHAPAPAPEDDDDWRRPRTPLSALPPARAFVQALVQRLLEVQSGARSVRQLSPDTTPDLYARLEQRLSGAGDPRDGGRLRSAHVQARPDGVAEACATVVRRTPQGPRVRVLALRLEGVDGRWCCTDLDEL